MPPRVSYYYDADVGSYTYGLGHPMKPHRIRMAHELIAAYDLLPKMHVSKAKRASAETMTAFHTDEYVHFLARVAPETSEELTYHGTRFLVGDDNPAFEGVFEFCTISAGGSLAASSSIAQNSSSIAVNWSGGLHHAKKREASGFCYINDIVLCILDLLRTFPRVLYVDIDCHHGDGVEEAFYTTDRVMTLSFHKYGEYFPGTGTQDDRGRGKGNGYAVNVPLKDGMSDDTFISVFDPVISRVLEVFRPSAIVLQCGADSLSGDKLGCFNLTMQGHAHCTQYLRKTGIPLILLGGGGYTVKNVARAWAYETACALGVEGEIDERLPWNEYFEWFGPRYRLEVVKNNMEDLNLTIGEPADNEALGEESQSTTRGWKTTSIDRVRERALAQLKELETRAAPSVQMMDVPRESVAEHIGYHSSRRKEGEWRDALDEKVAQHARFVYQLQSPSGSTSPSLSSGSSDSSSDDDHDDSDMDDSDMDSDRRSTRSQARSTRSASLARRESRTRNGISQRHSRTNPNASSLRRRMSIITNSLFDVSLCAGDDGSQHRGNTNHTKEFGASSTSARRRFFRSDARWDDARKVLVDAMPGADGAFGLGLYTDIRGPAIGEGWRTTLRNNGREGTEDPDGDVDADMDADVDSEMREEEDVEDEVEEEEDADPDRARSIRDGSVNLGVAGEDATRMV